MCCTIIFRLVVPAGYNPTPQSSRQTPQAYPPTPLDPLVLPSYPPPGQRLQSLPPFRLPFFLRKWFIRE